METLPFWASIIFGSPFMGQDDNGNFRHNLVTKFKQITDGLSKTMMVSETVQGKEGDLRG